MAKSHIGPSGGIDAVTVLTWYLCVLLAVPAPMIVSPLGTAGAPATILAVGSFSWWAWHHIHRDRPLEQEFQPVRAAMIGWLMIMLLVYAHAMAAPIPSDEISPADSGMLRLLAMAGLLLVANDGIASLDGARTVIRRMVIGVGIVAILGLVQYATRQLWVDRITIPGLTSSAGSNLMLASRSGLIRPSGTATHPIEFGVMLTIALPLTITYALYSPTRRWMYRLLLMAVAFAIFLSISRSAILCGSVGLLVLAIGWTWRVRFRAFVVLCATFVLVYLSVPGLLGTLTRLFTGISEDASITSRTGSYEIAGQFIARSPWVGRGFGTFLPKYWILDNGYLGLLIEGGVLGLAGLLVVIGTAIYTARAAVGQARDEFDRRIARALLASVAAGATALAFFDTFAYPQSSGFLFLAIGLSGAYFRLTRPDSGVASPSGRRAQLSSGMTGRADAVQGA